MRATWPCASRTPRPFSVVPQLLDTIVRSLTFWRASSWIQFSGLPDRPKPPARITAPSKTSCNAAFASGKTLFIGYMLTAGGHGDHHVDHGFRHLRRLCRCDEG